MNRITFITGYYGSGKTEVAINLAIQKQIPFVIDLDIINPYFRSRETEDLLKEHHIQVLSSGKEKSKYTDLPYISGEVFAPFYEKDTSAIYDLGGNDIGAKLLRQFESFEEEIDLLLVINIFRPETDNTEKILELIRKIESMGARKVTGLINNTNLLKETTHETVLEGEKIVKAVAKASGLPIKYTCIEKSLDQSLYQYEGERLPLTIYLRKKWY